MEILTFVAVAAILLLAGIGFTVAAVKLVPLSLLERAQDHGRFAGLGSNSSTSGGSGSRVRVAEPVVAQGKLQLN